MDKHMELAEQTIGKEFDLAPPLDKVDFINHLAIEINTLILNDFNRLVNILYRIDISEAKLKELLTSYVHDDAGYIIAQLIIQRQLEKIKSREVSKRNDARSERQPTDNDEPQEEKW